MILMTTLAGNLENASSVPNSELNVSPSIGSSDRLPLI